MNTTTIKERAPRWVRLPAAREGSHKLGLSRSQIYRLAAQGRVRLGRGIAKRGERRGVTFVDLVSVKAYLAAVPAPIPSN